jgi:hypothetical protein
MNALLMEMIYGYTSTLHNFKSILHLFHNRTISQGLAGKQCPKKLLDIIRVGRLISLSICYQMHKLDNSYLLVVNRMSQMIILSTCYQMHEPDVALLSTIKCISQTIASYVADWNRIKHFRRCLRTLPKPQQSNFSELLTIHAHNKIR